MDVVHGGLEARVPTDLLNGFIVHAVRQHQRRCRVPHVVEADALSTPSFHIHFEPSVRKGVMINGSAFLASEDRLIVPEPARGDELSKLGGQQGAAGDQSAFPGLGRRVRVADAIPLAPNVEDLAVGGKVLRLKAPDFPGAKSSV